jgi:hypothetical protein
MKDSTVLGNYSDSAEISSFPFLLSLPHFVICYVSPTTPCHCVPMVFLKSFYVHKTLTLLRYFNKWKLRVKVSKTELILFTKRRPPDPQSLQFHNATIPWSNTVKYLRLILDSKRLFTKHLQTILHKATGTLLKIFPLLARDSPLTIPNKILLYKLLLRSMITYAAPVWSSTSQTNYRHLQVYQSKCLRVIGDLPGALLYQTFTLTFR